MDKKINYLVIIALFLLLAGCGSAGYTVKLTDANISQIQETIFQSWDGSEVRLADFEGRIVVVDFWETWCGPCLVVFPQFQEVIQKYPDEITVIAASPGWSDTEEDVQAFRSENQYDFVYVEAAELASALGFRAIPFKVIFDREGNLITYETGATSKENEKLEELIAGRESEH